jgi:hypothetical protein
LPFQCRPICLRSAAAKILYVEASHAPILNEWMLRLNRLLKNSADFVLKGRAFSRCGRPRRATQVSQQSVKLP